jgi:hypothetical protein
MKAIVLDRGSRTLEIGECTSGEPDSGCPVGTAARTRIRKAAPRSISSKAQVGRAS